MDKNKTSEAINKLVKTMSILRSPEGCPWDKEQTPESLKPYILEEAYELIEAIDSKDTAEICDELGDLLLQVVFLAQIYNEQSIFTLSDVANSINAKLIRRHPHVFSDANAADHAIRWDKIKLQERTNKGKGNKLADRVPRNFPALKQAAKVIKKTYPNNNNFDTNIIHNYIDQLSIAKEQVKQPTFSIESTLGDLLFGISQIAISLNLDAEDILRKKNMEVMTNFDN